jgi:DNA-binding NarL/FixJ family response regulator
MMPADVLVLEIAPESDPTEIVALIQHLQGRHSSTAVVVIGPQFDEDLAMELTEQGAQDVVGRDHVGDGLLARAVMLAASRQHRQTQGALNESGFDETLTSRAGLHRLRKMTLGESESDVSS